MVSVNLTLEAKYWKKGLAVCEEHILTDTMFFKFRNETFEFPTRYTVNLGIMSARDSGYGCGVNEFPSVEVKELRKLKKELEKADGRK